jgi:hypothetical protein
LYTAACIGFGSMFLYRFCVDAGEAKVVGQVCGFGLRREGCRRADLPIFILDDLWSRPRMRYNVGFIIMI